jgi:hypothetical protein
LALFSEQFNNAAYAKADVTISANATDSPDGTQSADKIIENTVNDAHAVLVSVALASGTHTYSFFAKASGRSLINVQRNNSFITSFSHDYNLAAGTASGGGKIEPYANGFFRCSGVFEVTTASTTGVGMYLNNGSGLVYTGDGTSGAFVWGWQLELGSYPTSYIPTLGSSVTRLADVATKFSISSLIGQTEGTLFGEFAFPNLGAGGGSSYVYFTDGSFTNSVIIGREPASPNSKLFFYINAGGSNVLSNTANNLQSGFVKMAIGYKSGSWAAYLNGSLVASGTDSLSFSAAMSSFGIGTNDGAITIVGDSIISKQAALYTTRLSNSQLASLTSL